MNIRFDKKDDIIAPDGTHIEKLNLHQNQFVDKTTILYGPTGSGKTVVVKSIMEKIKDVVTQGIIVSPSEPTNRSYEGFVDKPLIHYYPRLSDDNIFTNQGKACGQQLKSKQSIRPVRGYKAPTKRDTENATLEFLQAVWNRQEMLAALYTKVNNLKTLSKLFDRLPKQIQKVGSADILAVNKHRVSYMQNLRKKYHGREGELKDELDKVNERFIELIATVYKKYIIQYYDMLYKNFSKLSPDEREVLYYIDINPRFLIVFDDCAAEFKQLFNRDIFRKYFYQNRHVYLTVILCCQDDTDIPANLRKNAFISVFNKAEICQANFERTSNQHSKHTKEFISSILELVYEGYKKLVYIRDDPRGKKFYYVDLPVPRPFRFGSQHLQKLCRIIKSDGVAMDKDNPYYNMFSLKN